MNKPLVKADPDVAPADRLQVVHTLRGCASLAVCCFHLAYAGSLNTGLVGRFASHGSLGVQVFFVISGFILPYSLWKAQYTPRLYGRFILKRVIRLDPPYVAAIILTVALGYAASIAGLTRGATYHVTAAQLLRHLGYLNVFFQNDWVNPVFWTLAIEFQYYLALGVVFPLLNAKTKMPFWWVCIAALAGSFVISNAGLIPHYSALFLLGISIFRNKAGAASVRETVLSVAVITVIAWAALGTASAAAGLLTALSIAFLQVRTRATDWLGDISYSLYLIHAPVGARICNLASRLHPSVLLANILVLGVIAITLVIAYAFYLCVERPSQRLAARVLYRTPQRAQVFPSAAVSDEPMVV